MIKISTVLAAAAALPLMACNLVVSEKPWFTETSGPQFKDGLWVNLDRPDCAVEPAAPISAWPDCASPVLIKGGTYFEPSKRPGPSNPEQRNDPAKWDTIAHVLVDGVPQIDQLQLIIKEGDGIRLRDGRKEQPIYLYLAVRPVAKDDRGLIIESQRWPVLCGPPPAKPTGSDFATASNSDRPFKGIKIQDGACLAESVEALRGAAAESEAIADKTARGKTTSRWVRPWLDEKGGTQ